MISFHEIRDVHLEISSLCNAACPWCPRTFWGYPYNGGYPEVNLTLESIQRIFPDSFLSQLDSIRINGNFGDIVMNPQGADIVEYFLSKNSALKIRINTNGSARNRDFWTRLARTGSEIGFGIDGLRDTHHLYRQNTSWDRVIKNAKIVIENGGHANWQMIEFDHNRHQIKDCQSLSKELGFKEFKLIKGGRTSAPVFDKKGNLTHILGDYNQETDFQVLFFKKTHDDVLLEDVVQGRSPCDRVSCETVSMKSIYIAANGEVYPCCYTGLYPRTFGKGQYHQAANHQLIPLIEKNNALEYPLEECIKWFGSVEKSWQIDSYQQGRLLICDDSCGTKIP